MTTQWKPAHTHFVWRTFIGTKSVEHETNRSTTSRWKMSSLFFSWLLLCRWYVHVNLIVAFNALFSLWLLLVNALWKMNVVIIRVCVSCWIHCHRHLTFNFFHFVLLFTLCNLSSACVWVFHLLSYRVGVNERCQMTFRLEKMLSGSFLSLFEIRSSEKCSFKVKLVLVTRYESHTCQHKTFDFFNLCALEKMNFHIKMAMDFKKIKFHWRKTRDKNRIVMRECVCYHRMNSRDVYQARVSVVYFMQSFFLNNFHELLNKVTFAFFDER